VQVGEQGAAGPHPPVLLGDRFLHLQHQVDVPDVVRVAEDLGAGGDEVVVRDRRADPGLLLDVDAVARPDQLVHAGRGDGHPVFVVLQLARDADLHPSRSLLPRGPGGAFATVCPLVARV
jgi:hypothetical protein